MIKQSGHIFFKKMEVRENEYERTVHDTKFEYNIWGSSKYKYVWRKY